MLRSEAKMQYKCHYVTVKAVNHEIFITAPTWRSRRWTVKQIKCEAKKLGVKVIKLENTYYYVLLKDIKILHSKLIPAIRKCNVLRSERQRKYAMKN